MLKALVNKEIMYASNAKSGQLGKCPHCGKSVRARCGEINIEHWAHLDDDCPYITEKDTVWHIAWKNKFEKKGYLTEQRFGNFISDAYNPKTNTVIEFQHSNITPKEIKDRCNYYESINKNIKWIFDYTDKYKRGNIKLTEKNTKKENEYLYAFEIKWQKKSYVLGTFSNNFPNIPVFFNIIYNYNTENYTQLRIAKDFDEYKNEKYINRYRNYLVNLNNAIFVKTSSFNFKEVFAELYYNAYTVLLKPTKVYKDGKYGYGELIFE